jgi:hypothetical protein
MTNPTRDEFVKAARTYALAYGHHDDAPSYLPRTEEQAATFEPHAWVIGALMHAFSDGVADGRGMERSEMLGGQQWQPICTAPREQGKPILVSWPVRELDDDDMPTGPILRRVTLITEMNGNHWLDPDVCNAVGVWFGDDYAYAEQPDLWMPVPASPAI